MELAGGDVAGAVGFDLDLDIAVVDFADDCGSFAAVRTANDVVADFADHDCGGFAAVHVANVAVADLPVIPKFVRGGTNKLCYCYLLGHCVHGPRCTFIHAHQSDVELVFINSVLTKLKSGFDWIQRNEQGAPGAQ